MHEYYRQLLVRAREIKGQISDLNQKIKSLSSIKVVQLFNRRTDPRNRLMSIYHDYELLDYKRATLRYELKRTNEAIAFIKRRYLQIPVSRDTGLPRLKTKMSKDTNR